ncbi:hypothetical protein L3Q82_009645, partial [Scortum barcoo]
ELIASLENVEAIAKIDSFSEDLLQQYGNRDMENIHLFTSTEYPQILKNVAATCTGNEDESPVLHTAAPEMTVDELTEKHPNSALHCSSSQEHRLLQLNVDKNLDDKDQVPGVSWAYKHMTEKKKEDEDEPDDWIVIPISMSELKFEPEDEDQDSPENVLLEDDDNDDTGEKERSCGTNPTDCELHRPSPKPVPASARSQIEVFETVESFLQAKAVKSMSFEVAPGRSTAEHEMDSEGEPYTPQNKQESHTEPEDMSETEDSCDYSSGSEHNYLTVSRELLK